MNTTRLYYSDSYATNFDARVISILGAGTAITLDRTLFYPTSGGQPHDTGSIAGISVIDVRDQEDEVVHILASSLPERQLEVTGVVDWKRRYDHMQQHTGQHLLSAVFVEVFGIDTLSFHMGDEVSTIELAVGELSDRQVEQAEARALELIGEARPVRIGFEEAGSAPNLRRANSRSGTLRIIEIDGLDRSACGGTHVRSTAALGFIQIRGRERVRGHVRVEFVCGYRALSRAQTDYRLLKTLSSECGTAFQQLPEWAEKQRAKSEELEKDRHRLTVDLARRDAAELYRNAEPDYRGLRRTVRRVDRLDEYARALAAAYHAQPKALLLILASDPAGALLAASPDSGYHAGNRVKELLQNLGGRGGGSAVLAQGSVPADRLRELSTALGFDV